MKTPGDKEMFDLFRARLTNTDKIDAFSDENWDQMEELLDGKTRKNAGIIWLYRFGSGIAAMLLLFLAWQFLAPKTQTGNKIANSSAHQPVKPSVKNGANHQQNREMFVAARSKKSRPHRFSVSVNKVGSKQNAPGLTMETPERIPSQENARQEGPKYTSNTPVSAESGGYVMDAAHSSPVAPALAADPVKGHGEKDGNTIKNINPVSHSITLSVLAASDINGVNSFNGSQAGTNIAMQVSLKLTKRLSISSGAAYAVRPYQTSFSSYKTNSPGWWGKTFVGATNKPDEVSANCKILDIPLNLDYQVLGKGKNSLMIGGGLSSYIMLRENYRFSFQDAALTPRNIDISNQNQHLFGVLNLNATYQRQVNNNLGIIIQPYMKLPLTQIGFGQVDLKSTGVALGFSWNIRSFKGK